MAVIATAGTAAQRWGWLVIRAERTRIIAQPRPKPRSADPVMTLSVAPGKTTRHEDQGGHRSGDQRAGDDARDRNGPGRA